jgi:AraC-like DNA-binding protein
MQSQPTPAALCSGQTFLGLRIVADRDDSAAGDCGKIEAGFRIHLEKYAEAIAVEKGARLAHLSRSRFGRVFKEFSGMTFVAYLTHVRLSPLFGY